MGEKDAKLNNMEKSLKQCDEDSNDMKIPILDDIYNILIKEQREHITKEKQKIREEYPRLHYFFGLATPEVAKLLKKMKIIEKCENKDKNDGGDKDGR